MATVEVIVTLRKRWWFDFAFEALAIACAATSLFSLRLAHMLSDGGSAFMVRHGLKTDVR